MPFRLPLPPELTRTKWKVKIFDKENREPPHITIIQGRRKWRINLRTGGFMDARPPRRLVDPKLLEIVQENWELLKHAWDRIHPGNPVEGDDDDSA